MGTCLPLSLVSSVSLKFGSLGPQAGKGENIEIKFGTNTGVCYYTYIDPCFRNVHRSCAAEADGVADIVGVPGTVTSCLRRPCRAINSSFRLRNGRQ